MQAIIAAKAEEVRKLKAAISSGLFLGKGIAFRAYIGNYEPVELSYWLPNDLAKIMDVLLEQSELSLDYYLKEAKREAEALLELVESKEKTVVTK